MTKARLHIIFGFGLFNINKSLIHNRIFKKIMNLKPNKRIGLIRKHNRNLFNQIF